MSPLTNFISRDELLAICEYLPHRDIVILASACTETRFLLHNEWLWRTVGKRDGYTDLLDVGHSLLEECDPGGGLLMAPCRAFRAYQSARAVAFPPIVSQVELFHQNRMPDREGHAQCVLMQRAFVRGGFVNDSHGWLLNGETEEQVLCVNHVPIGVHGADAPPSFPHVYGHRMTAVSEREAVLYGGCASGGYVGQQNIITLMCILPYKAEGESIARRRGARHQYCFRDLYAHDLTPTAEVAEKRRWLRPRAYHDQCLATAPGAEVALWIAGGLLETGGHDPLDCVYSIPLSSLADEAATAQVLQESIVAHECGGVAPRPRFGHSLVHIVARGSLFLSGGYTGAGMYALNDGEDLTDIWELQLGTLVWRSVVAVCPIGRFLGRCHTANTLGPAIIYFGGTFNLSDRLVIFDIMNERFIIPQTSSVPVVKDADEAHARPRDVRPRLAHAASMLGTRLIVTGGWCHEQRLHPIVIDMGYALRFAAASAVTDLDAGSVSFHIHRALAGKPKHCIPLSHLGTFEDDGPVVNDGGTARDRDISLSQGNHHSDILRILLVIHNAIHDSEAHAGSLMDIAALIAAAGVGADGNEAEEEEEEEEGGEGGEENDEDSDD